MDTPPLTSTNTEGLTPFLSNLVGMLHDRSITDIISWSSDGLSFIVHDKARFENHVLPAYFKHHKFTSFVRQLNMYSFSKIGEPHTWQWRHKHVRRDQPELLKLVQRKAATSSASGASAQSSSDIEKVRLPQQQQQQLQWISGEVVKVKEENSVHDVRIAGLERLTKDLASQLGSALKEMQRMKTELDNATTFVTLVKTYCATKGMGRHKSLTDGSFDGECPSSSPFHPDRGELLDTQHNRQLENTDRFFAAPSASFAYSSSSSSSVTSASISSLSYTPSPAFPPMSPAPASSPRLSRTHSFSLSSFSRPESSSSMLPPLPDNEHQCDPLRFDSFCAPIPSHTSTCAPTRPHSSSSSSSSSFYPSSPSNDDLDMDSPFITQDDPVKEPLSTWQPLFEPNEISVNSNSNINSNSSRSIPPTSSPSASQSFSYAFAHHSSFSETQPQPAPLFSSPPPSHADFQNTRQSNVQDQSQWQYKKRRLEQTEAQTQSLHPHQQQQQQQQHNRERERMGQQQQQQQQHTPCHMANTPGRLHCIPIHFESGGFHSEANQSANQSASIRTIPPYLGPNNPPNTKVTSSFPGQQSSSNPNPNLIFPPCSSFSASVSSSFSSVSAEYRADLSSSAASASASSIPPVLPPITLSRQETDNAQAHIQSILQRAKITGLTNTSCVSICLHFVQPQQVMVSNVC